MKKVIQIYYLTTILVIYVSMFLYNYITNFTWMVNRVFSASLFRGIYYFIEYNFFTFIGSVLGAIVFTALWGTLFLPIYLAVRWSLITIYKFFKGTL